MMSIVLLVAKKKTRQSLIFRRRLEIVLQRKHASNEKSWTEEINTTINHFVAANTYVLLILEWQSAIPHI